VNLEFSVTKIYSLVNIKKYFIKYNLKKSKGENYSAECEEIDSRICKYLKYKNKLVS